MKGRIFSLVPWKNLEVVIFLYLQQEKGVVFSNGEDPRLKRHHDPFYEFQGRETSSGRQVYAQVKSGNQELDPSDFYDIYTHPYVFYLFSPVGYKSLSTNENVVCLDPEEIENFLERNRDSLPSDISKWLDVRDELDR